MNREIKFRAWIKSHQEMIVVEKICFDGYEGFEISSGDYEALDHLEVELMQWTGIKDKNGINIYEGDVLARTTIADRIVIFEDGGFQTRSINNPAFITHINIDEFDVVIGNVYEHKSLLKQ